MTTTFADEHFAEQLLPIAKQRAKDPKYNLSSKYDSHCSHISRGDRPLGRCHQRLCAVIHNLIGIPRQQQ